jgi:thiol:disulfide interchange protein DsbD
MPRLVLLLALFLPLLQAQTSGVLTIAPPQNVTAKRNEIVSATIRVELRNGYHVNSNTPADDYLIPLRLTWDAAPLEVASIRYPKPRTEKYAFSSKPLSVFTGDFDIVTRFKVPEKASMGTKVLLGKLRYQACTNQLCLPPKNVEVRLPVDIR